MGEHVRLSRQERRLLVRLVRAGAHRGGRSHPIPNWEPGERSTGVRLCDMGLLVPDGDEKFFIDLDAFRRARRTWRLRAAVAWVLVVLVLGMAGMMVV